MRRSPFDETVKCRKCGWRGPFLLPNRADQQSLFRERRGWIVVRRLARLRPWLERKIYEEATGGASQDETWLATWLSYYWHLLGYTQFGRLHQTLWFPEEKFVSQARERGHRMLQLSLPFVPTLLLRQFRLPEGYKLGILVRR